MTRSFVEPKEDPRFSFVIKEDATESAVAEVVVTVAAPLLHPHNSITASKLLTNFFNIIILSSDMCCDIIRIRLCACLIKMQAIPYKIIPDLAVFIFH